MKGRVNLGFIGTGRMAAKMAGIISGMIRSGEADDVNLYSVYCRDLNNVDAVFSEFGKRYDDLNEMLSDPALDMVYIASPTSEHYKHSMSALEHGKGIFAEKPFTACKKHTTELFRMAESKNLFAAEALWTMYQPLFKTLIDLLSEEPVGKPISLTANLCYPVLHKERLLDPRLAGGALLEVGIYLICFAEAVFGNVEDHSIQCIKSGSGMDLADSIILRHTGGQLSALSCGINSMSDGKGIIHCEKGYIEVDNVNNFRRICLFDNMKKLIREYNCSQDLTGYEYEIKEAVSAYRECKRECLSVTHDDTIKMIELCDKLRESIGLRYPFEDN